MGNEGYCWRWRRCNFANFCYGYLDRKHTLYLYKASRTYFYVKEEPGDGSILSPNYLSTANIVIRGLSDWGTFQKHAEEQGSRTAPTIGGSPDTRRTA